MKVRFAMLLVVLLALTSSGCAPSIQSGQANVMRAVELQDINKLGQLAVNHGNDDVRVAALRGFQHFPNDEKAVAFIGEVLAKTYSPTLKRAAIQAYLYQLGIAQARSSVTDYLINGDTNLKMGTIDKLARASADKETKIQFMRIPLNDSSPDVRLLAAKRLRELGDLSGSEVVNELCYSSFLPIKRRAVEEMTHHLAPKYYQTIGYLLKNESDKVVLSYAQLASGKIAAKGGSVARDVAASTARATDYKPVALRGKTDALQQALARMVPEKIDESKYLIAIGVEKYQDFPEVKYAANTTDIVVEAFQKSLGVSSAKTLVIKDQDATSSRIKGKLQKFVGNIGPDATIIVYYAGHGVPSMKGKGVYLLPADSSFDSYEDASFEIGNFISSLSVATPRHVYAFIDSCFSGRVDATSLIFDGVASVSLIPTVPKSSFSQNVTLFNAAKGDQFANSYDAKGYRLFGYFLTQGLVAGKTEVAALGASLQENVARVSRQKGKAYSQDVEIVGLSIGQM